MIQREMVQRERVQRERVRKMVQRKMIRKDDPVYNVLNHLTEKFGNEEVARREVRRMSLQDVLIQNEYIIRGPKGPKQIIRGTGQEGEK